jgi:hypothetical protein
MKLIAVDNARALQLFSADEITPEKGAYLPHVIERIGERYQFMERPAPKRTNEGIKFHGGRFITDQQEISINELVVYSDGAAIQAPNTHLADIVLDDFIAWVKTTFGIAEPITKFPRSYGDNIVVDFDGPIEHVLSVLTEMTDAYSAALEQIYGAPIFTTLHRLTIATFERPTPALILSDFNIERRQNVPYSQNRYFCSAPLPTDIHLNLLQKLEDLALKR